MATEVAIRFMSHGRSYDSRLVAWCPECKWHLDSLEIGRMCPASECPRKLVKRRMWICDVTECQQGYKKLEDTKNHVCFSAY